MSIAIASGVVSCGKRETKLIPTSVLFGNPAKTAPQISPDANRLSYLAPYNGVLNVWVRTIGGDDDRVVTRDADRGIKKYFWAYDGIHIMFLQDAAGTNNWRLWSINLKTGETEDYTPFDSVSVGVVSYSKRFPHELIISMNRDNPYASDAYRLDLDTGALVLAAKNPGNVVRWIADADFMVRGAMASRPGGGYDLIVRQSERAPWRIVCSWDYEESASSGAVRFTRDGSGVFCLDARESNTGRLVKIAVEDGTAEVLAGDPNYEIVSLFFQVDTYEMQAVAYARSRLEWEVLDDAIRSDFEAVAKLDRGDFEFQSTDASDSVWVVSFNKDNGPVSYYLYDRRTKRGTFLFDEIPELSDYTLARMEPISFKARDGLTIQGYITYPIEGTRRNLPLVIRVHGGPWARDYWGYNPEVQWLASRGYACLQVNFRGSSGYGKDFANAGNREWGGRMQEDLIDAVDWAVALGIADSKRVAIFGSSYGGYAALEGMATNPGLFCCGIDVSGQSDLLGWLGSLPRKYGPIKSTIFMRVGNPETDAEFLKSRSPLYKADRIRDPLLVMQGERDPFVPKVDSERVIAALSANGVKCVYLLFPDEGQGISRPQNRMIFWNAAEKFLAEHLGGRSDESSAR